MKGFPEEFDSIFRYIEVVSQRAAQLIHGARPRLETGHSKPTLQAKEEGREMVIAFNFSGHGFFDLAGYEKYFAGELHDYELPTEQIQEATARLADLPKPEIHRTGKW